jgi:hypothetical protein
MEDQVLRTFDAATSPLQSATALADQYQTLYGVSNAFYRGIEGMSEELQKKLLASVTVGHDPIYGTLGPNTSTVCHPLGNDALERRLKLQYLYDKRNAFTHRLEQHHVASSPFAMTKGRPGRP